MSSIIDQLLERLGPAVLLPIEEGQKLPKSKDWQRMSLLGMQGATYRAELDRSKNIGVSLGAPSAGLCTIDVDSDEDLAVFLELNPRLREALQTRRSRGGNIWVRIQGEYPKLHKLAYKEKKDTKGRPLQWGEWRSTGGQTVIYGAAMDSSRGEASLVEYKIVVDARPLEIAFDEIVWPEDVRKPWLPEDAPSRQNFGANVVVLPSGEVTFTDAANDIFPRLARSKKVFQRSGAIMELTRDGTLDILSSTAFRSRLESLGVLMAWRKDGRSDAVLKSCLCSEDTAKALLASSPAREHLPKISIVTGCAVATEGADGNLSVLSGGYHEDLGGIFITSREKPQQVPIAEAAAALAALLDDFDFQSPSDRSRAIASFLSPAFTIGGLISGRVPADVAEADQSQAGKGYRQKMVAALYSEVPYVIAQKKGGVGGIEESFSQALLAGRPFIQIDNLRGAFDSQFFEAFFTADSIGARVPHKGEVQIDPRRFFIFASSNGVDTTQDFANRSSFIRIRKRVGHQFRAYPEGDLLTHVRARRSYYLGCIFSVITQWLARGKPRSDETRHDFREWAQVLDWIVQSVFGAAPLLEGHLEAQERVSNPALNLLRSLALAAERDKRLDDLFAASGLASLAEEHGIEIPGLRPGDDERAFRQIGIQLGRVFRGTERVSIDGFEVERSEQHESRSDGNGLRPIKHYKFTRL